MEIIRPNKYQARKIIELLEQRGGFDGWWGSIDDSIQDEIIEELADELDQAANSSRRSIIAKLAYWHGGHNASENSWGRLGMQVDVYDDEAVAKYFYDKISSDAREPLEKEITRLKALIFDLQNKA